MIKFFQFLAHDEDGAVTVDWVVLTAGVVGLAVGVIAILGDGPVNIGNAISSTLANDIVIVTE
jgi:hypothetical protein